MPGIHIRSNKDSLWLIIDHNHHNTLTLGMLEQLAKALDDAPRRAPSLVILTGMGEEAFCSGLELATDQQSHAAHLQKAVEHVTAAFDKLHAQGMQTIALVKGRAFDAGCELLLLCNTVIAREDATLKLPSLDKKIFPAALSVDLPAAVGQEETKQLLQHDQVLSAQEALHLGLVHQVLPTRRFTLDAQELLVMLAATA